MTQYGVAALVNVITINSELRLVLNHFQVSENAINYDAIHYPGIEVLIETKSLLAGHGMR